MPDHTCPECGWLMPLGPNVAMTWCPCGWREVLELHVRCDCGELYLRGGGIVAVWCNDCRHFLPLTPEAA